MVSRYIFFWGKNEPKIYSAVILLPEEKAVNERLVCFHFHFYQPAIGCTNDFP
jgi:hypothetical protein